jgi:spore cortex formation protein SpoVR/YcgB (stage V sporulation)
MLLTINSPFTMEVPQPGKANKKLSGFLRDLTKEEKEDFEADSQELRELRKKSRKMLRELERITRRVTLAEKRQDFDALEKLLDEAVAIEDELDEIGDEHDIAKLNEEQARERLELCLSGSDRDEIMSLAERHGHVRVLETVMASAHEAETERLGKLKNGSSKKREA